MNSDDVQRSEKEIFAQVAGKKIKSHLNRSILLDQGDIQKKSQ